MRLPNIFRTFVEINLREMRINPTRVLVTDIIETETETKSGIYIPNGVIKAKSMRGRIIQVGDGTDYVKIVHKVGDTALYTPSAGTKFTYEEVEYRLTDVSEILMSV